jgi:histidinol dehydrogenase
MTLKAAPARLSTTSASFDAEFKARLHWSADADAAIEKVVADILADVQKRGDDAVLEYTRRFDKLGPKTLPELELTQAELKAAFERCPLAQRDALQAAAAACAAITRPRRRPAARAGATATPTARCWGRRSRRWIASASTCPAARRRIRRAC